MEGRGGNAVMNPWRARNVRPAGEEDEKEGMGGAKHGDESAAGGRSKE